MCLGFDWDYQQQELEMNAEAAQDAAQQAINMIEKHGINGAHDGVSCAHTQIGLVYLGDNATDGYEAEVVVRANIQVDQETGKTPTMIGFVIPPGNDPVDEGVHVCQAAALEAFAKPRNKVPVPEYQEAPRYRSLADAADGNDDADAPPAMPKFDIEARTAVKTSEGTIFPFGTSAFAKSWEVLDAMDGFKRRDHHKDVGDSLTVAMVKSLMANGVAIDSLFELQDDLDMASVNAEMPASWTLEQRAAHACSKLDAECRLRFIDQFLPSLVPGMDLLIVVPKGELLDGSFSFTFKIKKLSAEGTVIPLPGLVHNDALDLAREGKKQLVEAPLHLYTNVKGLIFGALDWDQSTVDEAAQYPVQLYSAEELCGTHFGPSETPPATPYPEVQYGHQYHQGAMYRSLGASYGSNWGAHLKACKQLQQHMVGEVHKTHNDRLHERGLGELYVRPGAEPELFYTNLEGMEFPPYCCKAMVQYIKPRETVHEMRARTAAAAKARADAAAEAAAAAAPTPMSTDDLGHSANAITAPTQGEARNTLIHGWYNAVQYADGKGPHRRAFLMIATGLSSFAVANKTYVDGTWIIDDGDLTISALGSKEQNVLLRLLGALNQVNRFTPCVEYNLYLPTALAMMLGQFASSNPMCDEFAFYYAKALQAHAIEVYKPTADLPLVKVNTLLPLSVCYMFALFNQMKDLDQVTNEALDKGVKDWLDAHA